MDSAGKDSTIKHVMSGINPQGGQVYSFKQPSAEELDHDYLWRCYTAIPDLDGFWLATEVFEPPSPIAAICLD